MDSGHWVKSLMQTPTARWTRRASRVEGLGLYSLLFSGHAPLVRFLALGSLIWLVGACSQPPESVTGMLPVTDSEANGEAKDTESAIMLLHGGLPDESLPGMTPEVFAPGIISKAGFHLHSSLAFSPNEKEVYFTKIVFKPEVQGTIWCIRQDGEAWGEPETASFSGVYNDDSAVFSPDGGRLYFASNRPVDEEDVAHDLNIWFVERSGGSWGDPEYAGDALNSDYCDFRISFAANGTLYLSSDREGQENGTFDIFVSQPGPGGYSVPEKIGGAVNTPVTEQIGFVAPDESYLVFYRHDREKRDETGLYLSFRRGDGTWSIARNMGASFNSPPEAITQAASLSPDGELVFFLRRRHEAIYWVSAEAVLSIRSRVPAP